MPVMNERPMLIGGELVGSESGERLPSINPADESSIGSIPAGIALEIEVIDTGNTVTKMARDVQMGADYLRYFAGLGLEIKGETIPATPQNLHFTVREEGLDELLSYTEVKTIHVNLS
jgi:betaine-aldehyde dehydrogenase